MAQLNSTKLDFYSAKAALKSELTYIQGDYHCTIRGLSRVLKLSPSSLMDGRIQHNGMPMGVLVKLHKCSVEQLPDSLKPVAGFDYTRQINYCQPNKRAALLPEAVVNAVIKYYAYDAMRKKAEAIILDNMLSSVGLRVFFTHIAGADNAEVLAEIEPEDTQISIANVEPELNSCSKTIAELKGILDIVSDPEQKQQVLLRLLGI